jgi:predicted metalloprotease with PDZ domain
MIAYRIDVDAPHTHHYQVTLEVPKPAAEQRLSLPVWIPGSYMVREFGRHLSQLTARQGEREVPLQQLDKTTWLARCEGRGTLVVSWRVYAFDTSVRAAFLDIDRGFFNNTSLCLRVEGREHEPHRLKLGALPVGWQVATSMRSAGRNTFEAAGYDELVDHPVELGRFWRGRFEAHGVPHEFVVANTWPQFDGERLLADARRICEAQIAFWHGAPGQRGATPAPFERYVFLLNATEDGYGGLEHRASTALIAARRDLPRVGQSGTTDGYVKLLGLISHEYFHTWNVKRLRPAEFARFDYSRENYTQLLWFFEGFTSYYDDLLLLRAGLIDEARYVKLLSTTLAGVTGTPARQVQTVAQSSFDAWVKYYRGDENTPNSTVSYYTKGSLVALALDLALRDGGKASLDDLMLALWQRSSGGPVSEDDILQALQQLGGRAIARQLHGWVHGLGDLPLKPLLQQVGIEWKEEAPSLSAQLGLRLAESPLAGVHVKSVLRDGAAERAGVSPGDELLAVNGWRVRRLDDAQAWVRGGAAFELLLVRDQRLLTLTLTPPAAAARTPALALVDKPAKPAAAARRAWLHG